MITIIIGLPGSGKTYYSQKLSGFILDDFLNGDYINIIKPHLNKNIILIDPRMCIQSVFDRIYNNLIKLSSIQLILYKNDPEQCLKNIVNRDTRKNISETIQKYSKCYDLEYYNKYNVIDIKNVYQK